MKTFLSLTAVWVMCVFACIPTKLFSQNLVSCNPIGGAYSTGTVSLDLQTYQSTKQDDQIKVGPTATTWLLYYGWAVLDISMIPDAATIVSVTLSGYTISQGIVGNDCRVVGLDVNPVTASADAILSGMSTVEFSGVNYVLQTLGPWTVTLNSLAVADLQTKLSSGVNTWALGFTEYGGNDLYGTMQGYSNTRPQIIVNYSCNAPQPTAISGPSVACEGDTVSFTAIGATGTSAYAWTLPNGWAEISGQGTSMMTGIVGSNTGPVCVTATNGCGQGLPFCDTVSIMPGVTSGSIGGASSICEGNQVVVNLMALNATGAYWTVPFGWTIISGQGTLILTVVAGSSGGLIEAIPFNSCGDGPVIQYSVVVIPLPAVTMVSLTAICLNDAAILLNAGSPAGGTYSGPGVESQTSMFDPGLAGVGTHTIYYTVADGSCMASSSTTVFVDECIGSGDNIESNDLKITPNPNSGVFRVLLPEGFRGVMKVEVLDLSGRVLKNFMTTAYLHIPIQIPELRQGIYCLRLVSESKVLQNLFAVQN